MEIVWIMPVVMIVAAGWIIRESFRQERKIQELGRRLDLEFHGFDGEVGEPIMDGFYRGVEVAMYHFSGGGKSGLGLEAAAELSAEAPLGLELTTRMGERPGLPEVISDGSEARRILEAHFSVKVYDEGELDQWLERPEIVKALVELADASRGFRVHRGRVSIFSSVLRAGEDSAEDALDRLVVAMQVIGHGRRKVARGVQGIPRELFQARRGVDSGSEVDSGSGEEKGVEAGPIAGGEAQREETRRETSEGKPNVNEQTEPEPEEEKADHGAAW